MIKRPQLTIDELQQLKWLLGAVLTLLGVGTVFYMDVDAVWLMALTMIAVVATALRPTLPGRMPAVVHTLAFPAIVGFFVIDLWMKTEVLPAMVRLDIMLLLYRSVTYRQRRDDLQIIVLGLFLVVVAGVLTVSLTFAAHILLYTGCALTLLLVVTLSDSALGPGKRTPIPPGETPGWAEHADWGHLLRRLRDVTDWRVVGLGAVLFVGLVGLSGLLFLAIPRFQLENSMFLDRLITKKARAGFSESIRFGDVSEIQQDNSLALTVDVSDQAQIPASPYWRMLVLDRYENGTFKLSRELHHQNFDPEGKSALQRGQRRPAPEAVEWTFYLEAGVSRFLPLLGHFQSLRFHEVQNFRFAPRLGLIALRGEPVSMVAYRVYGFDLLPSFSDRSFALSWRALTTEAARRDSLQVRLALSPGDLALVNRAMTEATGGERLPAAAFARRVGDWLRSNHSYSLSPNVPAGENDPLVRWLTSREAGHCELFAGSFVLLARSAGFPARVVTGFRGGSWNAYSNNFTIRNSDAHAWAEIFDVETHSWLRADPLAPTATAQVDEIKGEQALVARMDRSWKARLDSLRVFWYRRIVSFDQQSQAETLKAVKEATQNSGRRLREMFESAAVAIKAWALAPWDLRRIVNVFAVLGGVVLAVWLWRAFGRRWWRMLGPRRGPRHQDPVRREAGRWLVRIRERAAVADPAVLAELQRLRFGAQPTWPEPEKVFRRARRALREVRSSV